MLFLFEVISHPGPEAQGAGHQGVRATGVPGAGLVRRGDTVTLANSWVYLSPFHPWISVKHLILVGKMYVKKGKSNIQNAQMNKRRHTPSIIIEQELTQQFL